MFANCDQCLQVVTAANTKILQSENYISSKPYGSAPLWLIIALHVLAAVHTLTKWIHGRYKQTLTPTQFLSDTFHTLNSAPFQPQRSLYQCTKYTYLHPHALTRPTQCLVIPRLVCNCWCCKSAWFVFVSAVVIYEPSHGGSQSLAEVDDGGGGWKVLCTVWMYL